MHPLGEARTTVATSGEVPSAVVADVREAAARSPGRRAAGERRGAVRGISMERHDDGTGARDGPWAPFARSEAVSRSGGLSHGVSPRRSPSGRVFEGELESPARDTSGQGERRHPSARPTGRVDAADLDGRPLAPGPPPACALPDGSSSRSRVPDSSSRVSFASSRHRPPSRALRPWAPGLSPRVSAIGASRGCFSQV